MQLKITLSQLRSILAIMAMMFACAKYIVELGVNQENIIERIEKIEKKLDNEAADYSRMKFIIDKQAKVDEPQKERFAWKHPTTIFR